MMEFLDKSKVWNWSGLIFGLGCLVILGLEVYDGWSERYLWVLFAALGILSSIFNSINNLLSIKIKELEEKINE